MIDKTDSLSGKTLVMIVGPAAIGKSSLMHTVTTLDNRFAYVRSFTSRPDRGDGLSTYRHITEDEARLLELSGTAVTLLRHPTTGYAYGTDTASYPAPFNLLDTLSSSVDSYRALPFRRTVTISLTADPDDWQSWLLARYPKASDERTKRLREAIASSEWSLKRSHDHHWLVNRPDRLHETARQLISLVDSPNAQPTIPVEARKLHDRAVRLLSYDQKEEYELWHPRHP